MWLFQVSPTPPPPPRCRTRLLLDGESPVCLLAAVPAAITAVPPPRSLIHLPSIHRTIANRSLAPPKPRLPSYDPPPSGPDWSPPQVRAKARTQVCGEAQSLFQRPGGLGRPGGPGRGGPGEPGGSGGPVSAHNQPEGKNDAEKEV